MGLTRKITLVLALMLSALVFGQGRKVDSLVKALAQFRQDTDVVWTLNYISAEFRKIGPDSALATSKRSILISEKLENSAVPLISLNGYMAHAYAEHQLGVFDYMQAEYYPAIVHYEKAIMLWEKAKETAPESKVKSVKQGMAKSIGNLGLVIKDQGNYPRALEYLLKALKLNEELNNKSGIAVNLINIGLIYGIQHNGEKALDYSLRSLKLMEELGDKSRIASTLSNIGTTYELMGQYSKGLEYITRALKMNEEIGSASGVGVCLSKIGGVYCGMGDSAVSKNNRKIAYDKFYPKALEYYKQALKVAEETEDLLQCATNLANIGTIYIDQGKLPEARECLERSLKISQKTGARNQELQVYKILYELYKRLNNPTQALWCFEQFFALNEKLFAEEKKDELVRQEMNYSFEKKEAAQKAEQDKKDAISLEEKKKQAVIRNAFIAGFVFVFVLALLILRGYRNKQKANLIITKQKEEVELKNLIIEQKQKEIVDSIEYAKRIQNALISNENYIQKSLRRLNKNR